MSALAHPLDEIRTNLGVNSREIAALLDASPSTVSRWESGAVSPDRKRLEPILQLRYVAERLAAFFPPEQARIWLYSPNSQLEGLESPASLIERGRLIEVLDLVNSIETGAYT